MTRLVVVLAALAIAGCNEANPNPSQLPEKANKPASKGAPPGSTNTDCHDPGTPVCKLDPGVCVACIDNSTCDPTAAPVCDTGTNKCTGCSLHADCSRTSGVCTPDGS